MARAKGSKSKLKYGSSEWISKWRGKCTKNY